MDRYNVKFLISLCRGRDFPTYIGTFPSHKFGDVVIANPTNNAAPINGFLLSLPLCASSPVGRERQPGQTSNSNSNNNNKTSMKTKPPWRPFLLLLVLLLPSLWMLMLLRSNAGGGGGGCPGGWGEEEGQLTTGWAVKQDERKEKKKDLGWVPQVAVEICTRLLFFFLASLRSLLPPPPPPPPPDLSEGLEPLLDGCRHVYLDVGSNVGVQVGRSPACCVSEGFSTHFKTPNSTRNSPLCHGKKKIVKRCPLVTLLLSDAKSWQGFPTTSDLQGYPTFHFAVCV